MRTRCEAHERVDLAWLSRAGTYDPQTPRLWTYTSGLQIFAYPEAWAVVLESTVRPSASHLPTPQRASAAAGHGSHAPTVWRPVEFSIGVTADLLVGRAWTSAILLRSRTRCSVGRADAGVSATGLAPRSGARCLRSRKECAGRPTEPLRHAIESSACRHQV
jgi:hypothetical protein